MTREEEIRQAAINHICDDTEQLLVLFEEGAKWADKTMLDKAVKWLVMNASDYAISTTDDEDNCVVSLDMVEDFCKAMEEYGYEVI